MVLCKTLSEDSRKCDASDIVAVPFINMQATNLDTIYSALLYAKQISKKYGQNTCIVTFDQPLYIKATDMIAVSGSEGDLAGMICKLGGFHLLMSFLGMIGYIMSGSGLEDLSSLIYAKNTVTHMLSCHAYSGVLRAHFLTYLAVHIKLWQQYENLDIATKEVGTDTDLFAILIARAYPDTGIFFLNPKTALRDGKWFNICDIQKKFVLKNNILFLHAMTGCDTASALFRKGKIAAFKLLCKDHELASEMRVFNQPDVNTETVFRKGEQFILKLYGAKTSKSLDELRNIFYKKYVARSSLSASFNLASLPPTTAAANQHSLRVYLQVQQWLGNSLSPTDWGWCFKNGSLCPIATTLPAAPEYLLNLISCNCKITNNKDCDIKCECRKAGLLCSNLCSHCQGNSCRNAPEAASFDELEEN